MIANREKIGLVIGNNYEETKNKLQFAVNDAIEVKNILMNPDICNFNKVEELIDATLNDAKQKIEEILRKVRQDDIIFIYFSGHGSIVPGHTNDLRLWFKDTREELIWSTSLEFDFFNTCIASLRNVVIVLDCCCSGTPGMKGTFSLPVGRSTVLITSNGLIGSQIAKEDEKLEHGVFTYYLIEGLKSGKAAQENGDICADDLFYYVEERMANCDQKPRILNESHGRILIGRNLSTDRLKDKLFKEYLDACRKCTSDDEVEKLTVCYENAYSFCHKLKESPQNLTGDEKILYNSLKAFSKDKLSYLTLVNIVYNIACPKEHDIEFEKIPAGKFIMGSMPLLDKNYKGLDENPHEVTIGYSFSLSKYPVTQKQWAAVMGKYSYKFFDHPDLPKTNVSWNEVQEFIKKLNENDNTKKYRLPSEAEWEYACRAGTGTKFYFGDDEEELDIYAWYDNNCALNIGRENRPNQVGKKKPNDLKLYDMHGNVWEWVQDSEHINYEGAPVNGSAWEDKNSVNRIIRGGSYRSTCNYCRSSARIGKSQSDPGGDVGFRLLKEE